MESPTVNDRSLRFRILSIIILTLPILFSSCTKDEDQVDDQKSNLFFEQAYPGISGEIVKYVINNDTITCEKINGNYVYQGDIILTEKQLLFSDTTKGAGLPLFIYRWPLNTVYYEINKDFPDQSEVNNAIKEYENKTPIKFVKRTNQPNYIEFVPIESNEIGGYSSLGMIGGMQKIGISKASNTGTVIHEIGHSIGLVHEQSRSDRDKYIIVNYQNMSSEERSQFAKIFTQVISLQFDFNSIMLYSCYAFSINGKPTITKLDGSIYTAKRQNLSDLDIVTINAMYKNFIYSNPSVNTLIPKNITMTNALIGCDVTSNGGIEITEKGVYWGTSMDPQNTGTKFILPTTQSIGAITKLLTGLKPNTTYFIKAYAINSLGPGYGNQLSFKTLNIPTVTTTTVTIFTSLSATVGGNVKSDGGADITERGVYWGTSPNPESTGTKLQIGSGTGPFSSTLSGLTPGRTYYVKAYATNSAGPAYGNQVSFMTLDMVSNNWSENFEAYDAGIFPSIWIADGNAIDLSNNYINSSISYEGNKSFQLFGLIGSCWAAIAYHTLTVTPPFEVELAIRNGNEILSGCNPDRASVGLREGSTWSNPSRTFLKFGGDGKIYGGGGLELCPYNNNTWYVLKIKYEIISTTEIKLSYWINNNYSGDELIDSINDENQLSNLEISVLEGSAWFDNIKVLK